LIRGSSLIPQSKPKVAGVAGNPRKLAGLLSLLPFVSLSSVVYLRKGNHSWVRLAERKLEPPVSGAVVAGIGKSHRRCLSFFPSFLSPPASTGLAATTFGLAVSRRK
jgi:hypothetical protein